MITVDKILANWNGNFKFVDWYAVEAYSIFTRHAEFRFVGNADEAFYHMVAYYAQPTDIDTGIFYRCIGISSDEAYRYFKSIEGTNNDES